MNSCFTYVKIIVIEPLGCKGNFNKLYLSIPKSCLRTFQHHIACFYPRDETVIFAAQTKGNSCIIFAGK